MQKSLKKMRYVTVCPYHCKKEKLVKRVLYGHQTDHVLLNSPSHPIHWPCCAFDSSDEPLSMPL